MLKNHLQAQAIEYLRHVLGSDSVRAKPLTEQCAALPYFIQEQYKLCALQVFNTPIVLACAQNSAATTQQIHQHVQQIGHPFQKPVMLAFSSITSGQRQQLIKHKLSFVVPYKQLFAPHLGMAFTERFGIGLPSPTKTVLSPSTQAILACFFNQYPTPSELHPHADAPAFGFSAMTASRAIKELTTLQLFELHTRGRNKVLCLTLSRQELWNRAKPHLRSPVMQTAWSFDPQLLRYTDLRLAGESALAQHTSLNAPPQITLACSSARFKQLRGQSIQFEPRATPGAVALQVWRYNPASEPRHKTVELMSLWLSLQHESDDRLQLALTELEEQFVW